MTAAIAGEMNRTAGAPASALRRNFNLTRELAWTQFKLKYTGSVLGYLWSLVKPAMLFTIMYAIFVVFFHQRANEFPLQLLVAIVVFTFFTECVGAGLVSIATSGHLIRKAFFPRVILVLASSMSAAMTFVINFALIVAVATPLGHLHLGLRSLVVIPLIAELYILALGLALLLAALYVFYRDLSHIWEIVSQVLFYASAIVYPITTVPARFLGLFFISPLAQIIEDVRHAIVVPDAGWTASYVGPRVLIPIGISFALLGVGWLVFHRLSPVFAENL
jgi:ABC-2 type transport system permease protein